jgi:hypothetical protein
MFVVPKGVEHKPYAEHEVKLLLIEPHGVLNTGHEGGERTAENDVWIFGFKTRRSVVILDGVPKQSVLCCNEIAGGTLGRAVPFAQLRDRPHQLRLGRSAYWGHCGQGTDSAGPRKVKKLKA